MAYTASLVVLLLIVAVESLSAPKSHLETYTYYATESRLSCVQKSSTACRGWWIFRHCQTTYWNDCSVVLEPVLRQGTRCQAGWSASDCSIPICSKLCVGGRICTAPEICECRYGASPSGGCLSGYF